MTQLLKRISNRALFIELINSFNAYDISYILDFSPLTNENNLTILDDTELDIYIRTTEYNILNLHNLLNKYKYKENKNYITVYNNIASVNLYFLHLTSSDFVELKDISVPKSLINTHEIITIKLTETELKITRSTRWNDLMEYKEKNKKKFWWNLWGLTK
jgi:hypothetical protein